MPGERFNPIEQHDKLQYTENLPDHNEIKEVFFAERMHQRENMAVLGGLLIEEAMLEQDGSSPGALRETFSAYKDEVGMAGYQEEIFKRVIQDYGRRKEAMDQLMARSPEEIVSEAFGVAPKEAPVVRRGAFTVHLLLDAQDMRGIKDLPWELGGVGGIYFAPQPKKGLQHPRYSGVISVGRKSRNFFVADPGATRMKGNPTSLSGQMFGERRSGYFVDGGGIEDESIRRHEETHAIYSLLMTGIDASGELQRHLKQTRPAEKSFSSVLAAVRTGAAPELLAEELQRYVKGRLKLDGKIIGNELFAFLREGQDVGATIKLFSDPRGYSFARPYHDLLTKSLERAGTPTEKRQGILDQLDKAFRREFRLAANAVQSLVGQGQTIEQAMVFLIDRPLVDWAQEVAARRAILGK